MNCPHCGYEADPSQEECPLCGTPLDGPEQEGQQVRAGEDAGAGAGPEGPGTAEGRTGAERGSPDDLTPWEAGGGIGALADSWWESLSDPKGFFSRIDWEGGWESPLLYYLLFSVLGAAFATVWSMLFGSALGSVMGAERMGAMSAAGSPIIQFFLSPFTALFSLAVGTAAAHVGVRVLASRPRPVRATARSFSYAAGPQILLAIPFVGGLVAGVWTMVLGVLGLSEAHRISALRAVGVLVVGFFVIFTGLMLVGMFVFALGLDQLVPVPATG